MPYAVLDQIGGERVAALFSSLRKGDVAAKRRPLSEKSVKNVRTTLAKILATAEEWGELASKPRLPKVKVPDPKWDHLTAEESDKVIAAARSPEERALLMFALRTGARAGEQRAIEWADLDWHNRQVIIRKSLAANSDEVGHTKSGKERRVPMRDALMAALKEIRGLRHLQGGRVFALPNGKPYSLDQLHERLWSSCRRAGVREVRWHDLRHSFASQLIASGVDIVSVQRWLGHSSIAMTMRYAHLAPGAGDAIEVLDRAPRCREIAAPTPQNGK